MTWQTVSTVQYFDECQKTHSDLEAYQDLKFSSESTVQICLKRRCILVLLQNWEFLIFFLVIGWHREYSICYCCAANNGVQTQPIQTEESPLQTVRRQFCCWKLHLGHHSRGLESYFKYFWIKCLFERGLWMPPPEKSVTAHTGQNRETFGNHLCSPQQECVISLYVMHRG